MFRILHQNIPNVIENQETCWTSSQISFSPAFLIFFRRPLWLAPSMPLQGWPLPLILGTLNLPRYPMMSDIHPKMCLDWWGGPFLWFHKIGSLHRQRGHRICGKWFASYESRLIEVDIVCQSGWSWSSSKWQSHWIRPNVRPMALVEKSFPSVMSWRGGKTRACLPQTILDKWMWGLITNPNHVLNNCPRARE